MCLTRGAVYTPWPCRHESVEHVRYSDIRDGKLRDDRDEPVRKRPLEFGGARVLTLLASRDWGTDKIFSDLLVSLSWRCRSTLGHW